MKIKLKNLWPNTCQYMYILTGDTHTCIKERFTLSNRYTKVLILREI